MSGIKKAVISIVVVFSFVLMIGLGVMYFKSNTGALKDFNDYICGVQDDFGSETHYHFGNYECSKKGK